MMMMMMMMDDDNELLMLGDHKVLRKFCCTPTVR